MGPPLRHAQWGIKKRRWGRPSPAWKAGSLVCGPWPHSSSPPVAGTPRCARNCSHQASGAGDTIPPPAVRAPPFTQGRLIRCGFAADLSGPLCGKKKCGRGPQRKTPDAFASGVVERAKGVEPSYQAWEACILPMNYARGNKSIIPQIFDFSRAFLHDGEKSFRQGAAKRDSGGAGPPLSGRLGFIPFSRIWPRPDGRFAGDWCRRRCGDGSPPDGA